MAEDLSKTLDSTANCSHFGELIIFIVVMRINSNILFMLNLNFSNENLARDGKQLQKFKDE